MKQNRNFFIILSLAYLAVPVAILVFLTLFGIRRIPDYSQEINEKLVPVTRTHPVTQTVIPRHDGFNTAVIYLRNKMLLNIDPLIFYLTDSQNQVLRQINVSGRNIGDGEMVRFQFPPLPDSAGKSYVIHLEAPQTNFGSNIIEAGFSNEDTYPGGESLDEQETGDLSFQLFYRPESKSVLLGDLITRIISQVSSLRFILVVVVLPALLFWWSVKFLRFEK